MRADRHQRLMQLFLAAVELPPVERDSFLADACTADTSLIAEVRDLIGLEQQLEQESHGFLEGAPLVTVGTAGTVVQLGAMLGGHEPTVGEEALPFPDWQHYRIIERIGSGGMAEVFKAFDPRLKRHVAIKLVRGASKQQVERFIREAEAQARVEHGNVLEVYETGEVEGRRYIAMRYVAGPTLAEIRDETTLEQKIRIMLQVTEAIHAAHRQGLIHRDIKPSNILVERDPDGLLRAYVMDFGIAAEMEGPGITATGEMLGTPTYMAPEQVAGDAKRLDRRTDVYGLGVTMYEFLSGARPFQTTNPLEILSWLREGEPRPIQQVQPDLPADLQTIVMKCLERDQQRRYPSARALAEDLERYLNGEPIQARRPTLGYRLLKAMRRHRAVVAVSTVAVIALIVMGVFNLQVRQQERRQARLREDLARDFDRRVTEIEFVMRMAHVAPLHDLQQEETTVREMMAAVRQRLEETQLLGEGSGHYAQGRGYLALGEHRRARESFERAWAQGYRETGVACGLGRVLAELYLDQVAPLLVDAEPDEQAARLAELDTDYRQPALLRLSACTGTGAEAPEYVEALVALLEQRYDDALAAARAGYRRLPWLHEAMKLEGDILAAVGYAQLREGSPRDALQRWTEATAAYHAAAAVARSDPEIYLDHCRLVQVIAAVAVREGDDAGGLTTAPEGELMPLLRAGDEVCGKALTLRPENRTAVNGTAALRAVLGSPQESRAGSGDW